MPTMVGNPVGGSGSSVTVMLTSTVSESPPGSVAVTVTSSADVFSKSNFAFGAVVMNCSYAGHSSEHSHLSWRMEETGNIDRGCLTTATKHWTSTRCAFKRIKLFHYLFSFYIPIETFFYSHFFSSFSIPSSFSTLFLP